MNLSPYFFRMPIRKEFTKEEFDRFIYFERNYGGIGGIRPNEVPYINYERTVSDDDRLIAITYRDDGFINMNWVQVAYLQPSSDKAKATFDTIVSRLKEKVPTYSLEELIRMYRFREDQQFFAIYATAVGAPWEYSQAHFDAMSAYAKDDQATVRAGVVIGIGYIGQTEYIPLLKKLAEDPDKEVAHRAQNMLEDFARLQEAKKL